MRGNRRLTPGVLSGCVGVVAMVAAAAGPVAASPGVGAAAHTVVRSSVGYPFHVGRWDSVKVTVDFGRRFTSVSKICLTTRFGKDDPVEVNEEIFVDYPEQAGETEDNTAHFLVYDNNRPQHYSTVHTWRQCVTPQSPRTPLDPRRWLDGRETLYVEGSDLNYSDDGTATINSMSAELYE